MALILAFTSSANSAVASAHSAVPSVATVTNEQAYDTRITHLDNGDTIFHEDGRTIRGSFNKATGQSTLTDEHGNTYVFQVFPPQSAPTITTFDAGEEIQGIACNVLLWAVELIHSEGWEKARKIISKAGFQGKAIAAAMWGVSTSEFLSLVRDQC